MNLSRSREMSARLLESCDEIEATAVIECNMGRGDRCAYSTPIRGELRHTHSRESRLNRVALAALIVLLLHVTHLPEAFSQSRVDRDEAPRVIPSRSQVSSFNEYQLIGKSGSDVELPCLVGKLANCGEPYFIAWYKFNETSRIWVRLELKSEDELATVAGGADDRSSLSGRARFGWTRGSVTSSDACLQHPRLNPLAAAGLDRAFRGRSAMSIVQSSLPQLQSARSKLELSFDCTHLTISALDLTDEGQYKCEITFSDSLDFDKCPASTLSQLQVIAQPNEPELLVNGRLVRGQAFGPQATDGSDSNQSFLQAQQALTFKEGAQIKLECQSSGGKPAPRIEWLNVSSLSMFPSPFDESPASAFVDNSFQDEFGQQRPEVQLMRLHWPQKKSTYVNSSAMSSGNRQLITSSSVTFSLSRYDLNSRFVCLVVPQTMDQQQQQQQQAPQDVPVSTLAQLGAMLNQQRAIGGPSGADPMLKWTKLDVQVKPTSVSLLVRDVEADSVLQPIQAPAQQQPFYSVQPNKLYAIQCLVEGSRPRSQVVWFNRTNPIQLDQVIIGWPNSSSQSDFQVPRLASDQHLISSFVRHTEQPNSGGTFRTIATLLITTKIWDNFEEFFCRVSNEAFRFDELSQVAPIISAKLFVNYAPLAWLELEPSAPQVERPKWEQHGAAQLGRLKVKLGEPLGLRCTVAANPLLQNAIVQIDWLKDGKKLPAPPLPVQPAAGSGGPRLAIEKTNHLHMPVDALGKSPVLTPPVTGAKLAAGSYLWAAASGRLLASSSLAISSAAKLDAGAYSCHYKLIPVAASPAASAGQQPIRITSGQANQSLQVDVIEGTGASKQTGEFMLGRKITWYSNGIHLHSSSTSDTFNFTLDSPIEPVERYLGTLTCSYETVDSPQQPTAGKFQGNQMRTYQSINKIDLRLLAGPRLVDRQDLMPQRRIFSELELTANPSSRLGLTCMAQCEPICSIDWYLERRYHVGSKSDQPLFSIVSSKLTSDQPEPKHLGNYVVATAANNGSQGGGVASPLRQSVQWVLKPTMGNPDQSMFDPPLVILENLVHLEDKSQFTWLRETILTANLPAEAPSVHFTGAIGGEAEVASQQLLREAKFHLQGAANVYSRFELTYNQLSQLLKPTAAQRPPVPELTTMTPRDDRKLETSQADEIVIKCKLNSTFSGRPFGAARGSSHGANTQILAYEVPRPNRWYPPIIETPDSVQTSDGFGQDKSPGATNQYRSSDGASNRQSNQLAFDSDLASHEGVLDLTSLKGLAASKPRLAGGFQSMEDYRSRHLLSLPSPSSPTTIDEMQASIVLVELIGMVDTSSLGRQPPVPDTTHLVWLFVGAFSTILILLTWLVTRRYRKTGHDVDDSNGSEVCVHGSSCSDPERDTKSFHYEDFLHHQQLQQRPLASYVPLVNGTNSSRIYLDDGKAKLHGTLGTMNRAQLVRKPL